MGTGRAHRQWSERAGPTRREHQRRAKSGAARLDRKKTAVEHGEGKRTGELQENRGRSDTTGSSSTERCTNSGHRGEKVIRTGLAWVTCGGEDVETDKGHYYFVACWRDLRRCDGYCGAEGGSNATCFECQ
jgi:hypothetical protein